MRSDILVINSGSSSLKFSLFSIAPDGTLSAGLHGKIDTDGETPRLSAYDDKGNLVDDHFVLFSEKMSNGIDAALNYFFPWLALHHSEHSIGVVAHRVLHGGALFSEPVRITKEVLAQLDSLIPLAPLHQPHSLAGIRIVARMYPEMLQIACFDTAFHVPQPWVMQAFALPQAISQKEVKRYGFHGLSYEYIVSVLPTHLGSYADGKVVVAHLGSGASMCAIKDRKSVYTTMGFSALDGLMMDTRCGSIDPGVLLYLMHELGMSSNEIQAMLYEQSGLLGVSNISGDMRVLQDSIEPSSAAAIDLYVHTITRELGALAALLGGLEALVFTGGIGQHSMLIRDRICQAAKWLGVEIDVRSNRENASCISAVNSLVSVWVIPTDEELMIARHARVFLESLKVS